MLAALLLAAVVAVWREGGWKLVCEVFGSVILLATWVLVASYLVTHK